MTGTFKTHPDDYIDDFIKNGKKIYTRNRKELMTVNRDRKIPC
jgi:hypothetical protein